MSVSKLSSKLSELRKSTDNKVTWEMIQKTLQENFGLFDPIKLDEKQEARIRQVYEENYANNGEATFSVSLYQKDEKLATVAKEILNEIAQIGWVSGAHSNGYVPVFSIGAGAEKFSHRTDNAEIPMKIADAAGLR